MFYVFVISFVSHQFPGSKPRPFPMTFDKPGRRDDDGMFQITNLARPSLYIYIYTFFQPLYILYYVMYHEDSPRGSYFEIVGPI